MVVLCSHPPTMYFQMDILTGGPFILLLLYVRIISCSLESRALTGKSQGPGEDLTAPSQGHRFCKGPGLTATSVLCCYFLQTEQLITLWVLFVFTIVGNSVVLFSTRRRKRKSRMTFFVTQLTITGK